jgi:hypothetical protein
MMLMFIVSAAAMAVAERMPASNPCAGSRSDSSSSSACATLVRRSKIETVDIERYLRADLKLVGPDPGSFQLAVDADSRPRP